jgi:ribosomal protein S18 acetylase RimI-like enzyme
VTRHLFGLAAAADLNAILACDPSREDDAGHHDVIAAAIKDEQCHLARDEEGRVVGYAILTDHFFGESFVQLILVAPDQRRRGIAAGLMTHLGTQRRGAKLFTSTNLSNQSMQRLLTHLGYELSGVIHHLDEGDPELIYVKRWTSSAQRASPS